MSFLGQSLLGEMFVWWVGGGWWVGGSMVNLVLALVQNQSFVLLTWTWTKLNNLKAWRK